ncbi:DUF4105 domain-containing protein [Flavobacterium crassostreae]|uniref:Lnb N-terminal periplasmic domain-containing protein n=1 Tax=Flavobacterium crassostreae TaxID=1763534 RepID=A0A1B9E3M1_9FLAO|nr:DUF4105 domain-containing protein [Flavobacterium crassostreae]OCB76535.1 hypothetical protein LPBF_06265 [Flavobacterium crassostreae]
MKNTMAQKALFLLFFILCINPLSAQKQLLSDQARVSVITCGTGNASYSLFGHTALRIKDPVNFMDVVYNYGAFDFNTPNFVLKFIKGDLQYFAVTHPYDTFISEYTLEKRAVYEQELNLSVPLKQELLDNLTHSLSSGDSYYTYKFIDKNCTSMVVDLINKTLKTKAIVKKTDTEISYRAILFPYFEHHFYEKLGTSIIFGEKVDRLATQLFLPFELLKSLEQLSYQKQSLIKGTTTTVLDFEQQIPVSWWNNAYTYVAFLIFVILINSKIINQAYLLIMALLGVFFVFAGFYSDHQELAYNYNILLFNPLLFVLWYFYTTKNSSYIYKAALANVCCLLVYVALVADKIHFVIVLPLVITNAIIFIRLVFQNYKKTPISI